MALVIKNKGIRDIGSFPLDWEDPLEEGMPTHSGILFWKNPMNRGAWQSTVHRATKSQTQLKGLSTGSAQRWDLRWGGSRAILLQGADKTSDYTPRETSKGD